MLLPLVFQGPRSLSPGTVPAPTAVIPPRQLAADEEEQLAGAESPWKGSS